MLTDMAAAALQPGRVQVITAEYTIILITIEYTSTGICRLFRPLALKPPDNLGYNQPTIIPRIMISALPKLLKYGSLVLKASI